MKILLVGPSRCGKDTMGEWLDKNTILKYGGTTSLYLCPHVAKIQELPEEEAYRIRHANRELWYETGNKLREADPGCLLRASLAHGDISAGVRDAVEIDYACQQRTVDHIVWIERDVPPDPTMAFDLPYIVKAIRDSKQEVELHVLFNHTDEETFVKRMQRFATDLDILPDPNHHS